MASSSATSGFRCLCSVSAYSPQRYGTQTPTTLPSSHFLSSNSLLKLKNNPSRFLLRSPLLRKSGPIPVVRAAQSNFFKVIQTAWRVGRDGIDAGTNLVPDSVPRPIARIVVTVVAVTLALFVLKSFLSTAFFVLATMGLVYFTFIALNKDEGPRGGGGKDSLEDPVEEARRIMEKYK